MGIQFPRGDRRQPAGMTPRASSSWFDKGPRVLPLFVLLEIPFQQGNGSRTPNGSVGSSVHLLSPGWGRTSAQPGLLLSQEPAREGLLAPIHR